ALIASLVINLLLVPSAFCDGGALSLRAAGLAGIFVGVLAGMAVVVVANRHFGGMTGDAFGAANEIGRAASLLALLRVIG
ncbi:TPA: hypothetical protein EYP44_00640, partial [Candidatus Bathyarchaeota archaeon]|nr:hypothetical protein [Candidatus Bathyarchaeota archaeon]